VDKIRISLKTLKQMYGLKTGRTVRSVLGDFTLASHPIAPIFLF
jgi:hypothetical protein